MGNKNINVDDVVIFRVDEYRNGNICEFDGHVQIVNKLGVYVLYLSGYRSRNDFIEYKDIIAKVDKSMPIITLKNAPFTGHFIEYEQESSAQQPMKVSE